MSNTAQWGGGGGGGVLPSNDHAGTMCAAWFQVRKTFCLINLKWDIEKTRFLGLKWARVLRIQWHTPHANLTAIKQCTSAHKLQLTHQFICSCSSLAKNDWIDSFKSCTRLAIASSDTSNNFSSFLKQY